MVAGLGAPRVRAGSVGGSGDCFDACDNACDGFQPRMGGNAAVLE